MGIGMGWSRMSGAGCYGVERRVFVLQLVMGLYILIFEVFVIVLYGIFVRTGSSSAAFTDLEGPLYFTLAWVLLNLRGRMSDWSSLGNYLFLLALSFQLNTLYLMFWDSAFNSGFSGTSLLTSYYLVINVECVLALLVTATQFSGKLNLQQLFALAMVEVFAFALNFAICQFGIRAITGGCTATVFLFGYVFAVPIRKLVCSQEGQMPEEGQRYFTMSLRLIGLVVVVILWPSFCSSTAIVDNFYLLTTYASILSTHSLAAEGFLHMFLGFCSAIGTSIGLRILGEKIVLEKFVNSLLLTGVFLSSSSLVIIDPFASLLMGVFAPLLLFLLEKYLPTILLKGYAIDAIILAVLGGIFDSIFAAGRSSRTPALANNTATQGGLQFAAVIVSACFAAMFGLLAAVILRCFNPRTGNYKDNSQWFIDQQTLPIYSDDPILKRLLNQGQDVALKQENALFNLKNSYVSEKARENTEMGRILKQQLEQESRIR